MPRKDGLPTNNEMLLSFNETAHRAYVGAFENTLEGNIPDELQDKRLKDITLQFTRINYNSHNPTGAEVLQIEALTEGKAETLPENFSYRHYPGEVLARYVAASHLMAETTLDNGLTIASTVPTEGIDADYTLVYRDGKRRHVSSYKEKPSKLSIAAGTFFAEQAAEYAQTDILRETDIRIKEAYDAFRTNGPSDIEAGVLDHRFELRMTSDLPLNGHESPHFLKEYATKMFNESFDYGQRAEYLRQSRAAEFRAYEIESYTKVSQASLAAYIRAQRILDK